MWESTTDDVIDYFFICSTFTPPLTPSHRQPHTNNVGLERDQRHFSFASAIYLSKPFSKSRFLFVFKPVSTGGGLLSLSGWVDRVIEGQRERGAVCVVGEDGPLRPLCSRFSIPSNLGQTYPPSHNSREDILCV